MWIIVLILIVLILIAFYRKKVYPKTIKDGLTYEIPYKKKDKMRMMCNSNVYTFDDILHHKLVDDRITSTNIDIDGVLHSNSDIFYIDTTLPVKAKKVSIFLQGNIKPKDVNVYYI